MAGKSRSRITNSLSNKAIPVSSVRKFAVILLFTLIPVMIYHSIPGNDFVDWDDLQVIARNPHIRDFSGTNLLWMATTGHVGQWQPLGWALFSLQTALFDSGTGHPLGSGIHSVSLLLHIVMIFMVFRFLQLYLALMPGSRHRALEPDFTVWIAGGISLLYGVHPLHVETVSWATAQPYIPAGIGCVCTMRSYLYARRDNGTGSLLPSIAWFFASLLFKPIGVMIPLVLLLFDWYPLGRPGSGRHNHHANGIWAEKIPYFVLSMVAMLIAPLVKSSSEATVSLVSHGLIHRIVQACYGWFFYIRKTVWPTNLSPLYELRLPLDPSESRYIIGIAGFVIAAVFLIVFHQRFRHAVTGILGYTILIVPVLGLVQSGSQETADRYAYLPILMLFATLASVTSSARQMALQRPAFKLTVGTAGVSALIVLSLLSWKQTRVWRDTETLWTRVWSLQKDSSLAQNGYGYVVMQKGRYDQAVDCFHRAIEIRPDNAMAHRNLWIALRHMQRHDDLLNALNDSVRMIPKSADAHYNLGNTLFNRGDILQAIQSLQEAVKLKPDYAIAHGTLSGAYLSLRDYPNSIVHARIALDLDPSLSPARRNLARALKVVGRDTEALQELREALRIDPTDKKSQELINSWETGSAS